MKYLSLIFLATYTTLSFGMDYRLKLHKVVNKDCRVMFFESVDSKEFYIEKFSLKDTRKYDDYKKDPVAFMQKERPVFGYTETLGHESKNHILSLLQKDIVLKYSYTDENGAIQTNEVALFQNISCE